MTVSTKTVNVVTVPANSTVTLDPGSAYQVQVVNTGAVMVGLAASDLERGTAANYFGEYARAGITPVTGDCVVTFPPGNTRWIYPTALVPITAQNASASAGQVTVTTFSQ